MTTFSSSDFDVVITDARLPTVPSVTPLRTLRSAILQSGFAHPHEIRLVDNAKVPLVKFRSTATFGSFDFDVSFNSPKGPLGARESLRLLEEVERKEVGNKGRARMMILLLKVLLAQAGLNEVRFGGLGGLSIFCLGVSFVQVRLSCTRSNVNLRCCSARPPRHVSTFAARQDRLRRSVFFLKVCVRCAA